uniref:Transposase n=1 Tax=Panagrellus redivivus TaxID=6233 RepID=A0A7E4VQT5_PANRE
MDATGIEGGQDEHHPVSQMGQPSGCQRLARQTGFLVPEGLPENGVGCSGHRAQSAPRRDLRMPSVRKTRTHYRLKQFTQQPADRAAKNRENCTVWIGASSWKTCDQIEVGVMPVKIATCFISLKTNIKHVPTTCVQAQSDHIRVKSSIFSKSTMLASVNHAIKPF